MKKENDVIRKIFERNLYLAFLLIIFSFQLAEAQIEGISEGDRVKVTAPSVKSGNIKGAIITLEDSFLTVSESDTTFTVDYSSIRSLKVSKDEKLAIGKGALIGGLSGALTVGMISLATNEPCDEDEWCIIEYTNAEAFGIGALIGGLGGMAAGALIGAFITIDRWEKVPVTLSMNPYEHKYWLAENRTVLTIRFIF
ncbi:MAG: hypothetical protein GVY20_15200 [Bacteroidetes bacterium]|jgi:hypothetical protein|nr:hypothetical protein [Bacteroidota bacterium]